MSNKLPEHLQPLYDELTVQLKDGRYTNESNSIDFSTAKEAIEHNAQMDKFVRGFDFGPTNTKPFKDRVKKTKSKPTQLQLDFNLNLLDELNGIRQGLQNLKQARNPVETKPATSSGLNYLMGVKDE